MTFIFTDEPINSLDELMEQEVVYVTVWYAVISVYRLKIYEGLVMNYIIKKGLFKKYQEVKM